MEKDLLLEAVNLLDTVLVQKTLRSGQSVRHSGSVVVLGDVNPGAEIIAGGHVIVMGSVRGMVHAGASGDESATVTAFCLTPTQLRICNLITRGPDKGGSCPQEPETAMIKNGTIVIEKYHPVK